MRFALHSDYLRTHPYEITYRIFMNFSDSLETILLTIKITTPRKRNATYVKFTLQEAF